MSRSKLSVIGAGNVGASVAQFLAIRELEGAPHWGYDGDVRGFKTTDSAAYKNLENSDVIVVTAGLARKPGMSRDDLLNKNLEIMSDVGKNIKKYSPDSIIVVVSNPADVMAYALQKATGIAPEKIIGLGGSLDSSRFRTVLAMELGVSVEDVNAFVIG